MELKEIASISGKPGLYKIIKPTYNGVIVESLDAKKAKMAVGAAHRVSILQEVSIYTTDREGSVSLEEVLHQIYTQYQGDLSLNNKSSKEELENFLQEIVPNYDRERVYVSDMKKLVSWYNILCEYSPETLESLMKEQSEEPSEETPENTEEVKAEASAQEVVKEEKPSPQQAEETEKKEADESNPQVEAKSSEEATEETKPKKKRRRSKKSSTKNDTSS